MKNTTKACIIISLLSISFLVVTTFSYGGNIANKAQKENMKNQTWAEKLGYPSGKKVIILHSDDAGMCKEANIATQYDLKNKHIQSAAVMMPCPDADAMIEWAIKNPQFDIGIHLTLTSEWKNHRWATITDKSEVPGLIDPEGKMWRSVPEVVMNASPEEVEKEICAQIDKAIAMGYNPSHIDTHMGTLYGSVDFIKVFLKVAEEYNMPANVIDLSDSLVVEKFKATGYPINDEVITIIEKYSLPKIDDFTSVPSGKTYEEKVDNFKKLVKSLKPGITEIIFHPSVETEFLKTITGFWEQRVWEAKMFSDPNIKFFFKEEGVVFTNWKEIMDRHNSKS